MKTLQNFLTESMKPVWKVKYVFTPEDIEFFKKDPLFNWDDVVTMFGAEPTQVACNQKNLIVDCADSPVARYIWFSTYDVPAKRVQDKDDSRISPMYIKSVKSCACDVNSEDGRAGALEIALQGLRWMIERGITK